MEAHGREGEIRVGRTIWQKNGANQSPTYPGFTTITITTKSDDKKFYDLGPYYLRGDNGNIIENIWQFSKVYRKVPYVKENYTPKSPIIAWEYPEEIHADDEGNPNENYFKWRKLGTENKYAVRYPVGKSKVSRGSVLYCLTDSGERLGYIEARKKIYFNVYSKAAMKHKLFLELLSRVKSGENILICETDGPHQESLDYYKDKYGVDNSFIENGTMLANDKNIGIMLNDSKYAFGHGYCLAQMLMYFSKL